MKKEFLELIKSQERIYSQRGTVTRTYRVKDQLDLFNRGILKEQYDPVKHLTCDVRLVNDGTMIYGVKLSPHIMKQDTNGNFTEVIYDGTAESPSGDIPVSIPLVGSYVFISWLNRNNAFVALQTNTENIIVGSTEGAYLDFYNREDTRVLDLKNADEFNISLNNSKSFNLKTDKLDYTTFLVLLERIILSIESAQIIIETENDIPLIRIETTGGKIGIYNDTEDLKVILTDWVDSFITYINTVTPGLILANPALSTQLADSITGLNELKVRLNTLLK